MQSIVTAFKHLKEQADEKGMLCCSNERAANILVEVHKKRAFKEGKAKGDKATRDELAHVREKEELRREIEELKCEVGALTKVISSKGSE